MALARAPLFSTTEVTSWVICRSCPSAHRPLHAGLRIVALALLLGSPPAVVVSDDPPPAGGGATPPRPPRARPPSPRSLQHRASPHRRPASRDGRGTAPLAYLPVAQSANGMDWTAISGATGASYDTGATDVGMNGRWYRWSPERRRQRHQRDSARLTVQAAAGGGGGGGTGPSGASFRMPRTRFAVAVTPSRARRGLRRRQLPDAAVQVPDGQWTSSSPAASRCPGFPGNTFLEGQWLAVTPVTSWRPTPRTRCRSSRRPPRSTSRRPTPPFPNCERATRVRVRFTLTQAAVDALGGQPVIFSAWPTARSCTWCRCSPTKTVAEGRRRR